MHDEDQKNPSHFLTIRQFCETYPWPSESAMRAYVYRAAELGIEKAFIRIGRRVLILPEKFFDLIQNLQTKKKS
jgi:hypothetical protein